VLPAGTVVGGYRVIRKIGEGGMATVYEAEDLSLNRAVALKILSQEVDDDVLQERFARERRAQAELNHPNIVSVYGGDDSEHGRWLAMQLVKGRNLEEVVEADRLTPEEVWRLLTPIAEALEAAHEKGLIHRDITLGNILVADDGTPFLADFGLTKRRGDSRLTATGQRLYTPPYVAPERLRDQTAEPASDVYSLAVVLFRCLCGRFPFEGDGLALVVGHLFEPPLAPTAVDGNLPAGLDAVMARGLAKNPAERFEKPSELIAAARASFEGGVPEPPRGRAAGRAWGVGGPRRPQVLAAVALLLFALGLGAGALADGSAGDGGRRVSAGSLEVTVPPGWVREKGVVARFPRLQLADPLTLVPARGKGKEAVIVGMSLARGKTLLPFSLRHDGDSARVTALSLGSLQALRYKGLGPKPKIEPWTVIVSPTSVGVATIACRGGVRRDDLHRACESIAGSLKLLDGVGYPVGPSPQLAETLRSQFGKLTRDVRRLNRRLNQATGSNEQVAAAAAMADAFRRCAQTLAEIPVSPQDAAHLAGLVTALRFIRDAYEDVAAALRTGNPAAYKVVMGEVSMTASILYNRIHWLTGLGYRVAESYPF
jgi:tRNA A-37 threonylcarbamoyl transferase component Bud32